MWGAGGHAYVYTIYGLHHCFNVVTREKGTPQAVLIRAGVSEDWWRGKEPEPGEPRAAGGPGLFCRALGIDRSLSGASLRGPELILEKGLRRPFDIAVGARVGVDYAGAAALWPLRFAVAGCSAVTRSKGLSVLR